MNQIITLAILLSFSVLLRECYLTVEYSLQKIKGKGNDTNIAPITTPSIKNTTLIFPKNKTMVKTVQVPPKVIKEKKMNGTIPNKSIPSISNQFNSSSRKPKLNAYERMLLHKKELRHEFVKIFAKQQDEELDVTKNTTKYVIFKPSHAGFGNSMAVLVEALLFAYFSNRHFYLTGYQIFSSYFDLPFKNYLLESDDYKKEKLLQIRHSCRFLESDLLKAKEKYIVFSSPCKLIDYFVYNDDYLPFFTENGFVITTKGDVHADLRKLLYNYLYTEIIQVKPFVTEEVSRWKEQLHWNDYYIIALQIRTGRLAMDDAINFFLYKEDTSYFIKKAEELTKEASLKQAKPVRWFVATDNNGVKRTFIYQRKDLVFTTDCKVKHSMADMYKNETTEGMLCTLVDGYLIASSDVAILTARSTYGIWAASQNFYLKRYSVRKGEYKTSLRNRKM